MSFTTNKSKSYIVDSNTKVHPMTIKSIKPPVLEDDETDGNKIPYKAYVDDLEYGAMFNKLDNYMGDIDEDTRFMKYKVSITLASWTSGLLGVFLILFARAETDAFSSQPKLTWLFILGCFLLAPVGFWFVAFFCASREERQRRREIRRRRKKRMAEFRNMTDDTRLENEVKQAKVQRVIDKKKSEYEKAIHEREVFRANPLGYPNPSGSRRRDDTHNPKAIRNLPTM
mmetsp:Transcript_23186/g.34009  ORF Transcript_23186/g.34009 Transcript_23186/m.34009 type:complete len:228 (+) Transcript_23186:94-777(+)